MLTEQKVFNVCTFVIAGFFLLTLVFGIWGSCVNEETRIRVTSDGYFETGNAWTLVTLEGEYGYINWYGSVVYGFESEQEAREAMLKSKERSREWDATRHKRDPKNWERLPD